MHLLDTNTVIYFFKGTGRVAERLLALSPREVSISAITAYEIEVGIAKTNLSGRADRADRMTEEFRAFLSSVVLRPFGDAEARHAARVRAELEAAGTPIGPYDILIAGTALANGATLVTRNVREFARVRNLPVEDWY
jgi:tRNA(fMet)-specific endonuclease VapC